jgi:hypothetical protein
MTDQRPRIEIDPNVRVRGNKAYAGFEDVQAAGQLTRTRLRGIPVSAGQRVLAWEPEDDIVTDAVVVDMDEDRQLIYLAVEWGSWREGSS